MTLKYDFSGWATRNDVKCSDGRTIRKGAFAHQDGQKVPLVWMHAADDDPRNVIGHAILEDRPEGVYMYGSFNETERGLDAKEQVRHGDITNLSIWAGKLKENNRKDVLHGKIKEVSLVMSGANPGAFIDTPVLAHSDEPCYDIGVIYTDEEIYVAHEEDFEDEDDEKDEEEKKKINPENDPEEDEEPDDENQDKIIEHQDKSDEKTVQEVWNEFTKEQKLVIGYLLDQAVNEKEVKHSDDEGEDNMKRNIFENDSNGVVLSHAERTEMLKTIMSDAKRLGSVKESFLQHMEDGCLSDYLKHADGQTEGVQTYGIENIDFLFPDAKVDQLPPEFIKRDTGWVAKVLNGASHSPMSRVKSLFADITEEEARAKGYIKGNLKKEEVFTLLKRKTEPTTVYKKQKMDRDDLLDITDFNVLPWLKAEMKMMWEEEVARAILVGDGRLPSDDDHIDPTRIRPIYDDADLFTVKVGVKAGSDAATTADKLIEEVIRNRRWYKGSGEPTFFTTDDWISEMLLLKDGIGHKLYKTIDELATTLRCKEIVPCEVIEGVKFKGYDLIGIMVNMGDYRIGADRGGEVSFFEDFDIDYNQQKYLFESRCSGALRKPFSAMTFYKTTGEGSSTGRSKNIEGTAVVPATPDQTGQTGSTGSTQG